MILSAGTETPSVIVTISIVIDASFHMFMLKGSEVLTILGIDI